MGHRLVTPAQWARLTQDEPYLRWGLDAGDPPQAWLSDEGPAATSRIRRAGGRRSLHVLEPAALRLDRDDGPDGLDRRAGAVARLITALLPQLAPGGLTVPRALAGRVRQCLHEWRPALRLAGPADGEAWDWMWTTDPAPQPLVRRGRDALTAAALTLQELDVADPATAAALGHLLTTSSPRHSAQPGAPQVRRWYGCLDPAGALVACAAWYESVPGVPLPASVAVRASHRRAGLGIALMTRIMQDAAAAGASVVTVDLYADNDPARRLYLGLGFTLDQEFSSWPLS